MKACLVNAFLYAPWLARPLDWLWQAADAQRPFRASADPDHHRAPGPSAVERPEDVTPLELPHRPGVHLSPKARRAMDAGQGVLL